jgi:hypothetical protein
LSAFAALIAGTGNPVKETFVQPPKILRLPTRSWSKHIKPNPNRFKKRSSDFRLQE